MSLAFSTAPGQTLEGRFLLVAEIARGGMATVYKAQDLETPGRFVAVKVPHPLFSSGVGSWSMFQREQDIGRKLDHPCLLKFVEVPATKHRPYLVTEYVAGITLAERLKAEGRLPESEAVAVVRQVLSALEHMHERSFVHYDVKPENVILCPDGTLRLIDLGLAHAAVVGRFSLAGAPPTIASRGYVAPEQIRRQRGRRSADIYAVGAMLYEMLTGEHPFPNDDPFVIASARLVGDPRAPRDLNPQISPALEEIVLRALHRDLYERYPNAAAMRGDLEEPGRVKLSGLRERLRPPSPLRRGLRLARYVALVGLLPLALQVALFLVLWRHFAHGH